MAERLARRREHIPNPILYTILYGVVLIMKAKLKVKFTFKARPAEDKGSFVLVSNHASRNDYVFTVPAVWPRRLNFVVGYNEFFRFPTALLLKAAQVIPKRNFVPDVHTIQSVMRIIRQGGHVMFMPEGMSSITGMCQPVMPGTGKLLKKLGVNVYYTKISGGYLTYTKHCLDERVGRTEVVVDKMFSPEELASLTDVEIEDKMNMLLAHDDYLWNLEAGVRFAGKGQMAKRLDTLLYMCPKCGAMYRMSCEGNVMTCTACGNKVEVGEDYSIRPVGTDSVVAPVVEAVRTCGLAAGTVVESVDSAVDSGGGRASVVDSGDGRARVPVVTDWTIMERRRAAEDVRKPGFSFSDRVKVGMLPDYRYLTGDSTSELCGEGVLTLTAAGLHFEGTVKGTLRAFDIPISGLPTYGMCTDISRFYTFIDGVFYEFYPERGEVLRWDHLTEEMHRFRGGKWQDTPYRQGR